MILITEYNTTQTVIISSVNTNVIVFNLTNTQSNTCITLSLTPEKTDERCTSMVINYVNDLSVFAEQHTQQAAHELAERHSVYIAGVNYLYLPIGTYKYQTVSEIGLFKVQIDQSNQTYTQPSNNIIYYDNE